MNTVAERRNQPQSTPATIRKLPVNIRDFLADLSYENYLEDLLTAGFDTLRSLKYATVEDLTALGLKPGHAKCVLGELTASLNTA